VLKQQITAGNEMADILSQVRDAKTANAWKKKLKQLKERLKELEEESKKLEKPTDDEVGGLNTLFEEDVKFIGERYMAEIKRVRSNGEIWPVIEDIFNSYTFNVAIPEAKAQNGMKPPGGGMPGGGMPGGGMPGPNGGPNGPPNGPPMGPPK
jgi:seryl-tRNA synthetase